MKKVKLNKEAKKKLILLASVLVIMLALFVGGLWAIKLNSVRNMCRDARAEQQGSCVINLTKLVVNPERSFAAKNAAIWTLGQLADPVALATLEALATTTSGQDDCRRNSELCASEIAQAIKLCRRGNMTSWLYRGHERW